jgi:hypothetical protein
MDAVLFLAGYTGPKPVKASSLRAAYVGTTVITLWALASAQPSAAHVDVRPELVERGEVTELTVELPLLAPGPALVRLELEGDGVEVLATRKLPDRPGPEAHWTARVRVDAPVGAAPYVLRAVYADGDAVELRRTFTVVPTEGEAFPWAFVLAGAGVAIGAAAAGLALLRRRA